MSSPVSIHHTVAQQPLYISRGNPRVLPGPFSMSDVMLRALPLEADHRCLQWMCDRYLNLDRANESFRFVPLGRHVLLFVSTYGRMEPVVQGGKQVQMEREWWAQEEIAFAFFVVEMRPNSKGQFVPAGLTLFSPFVYVDSVWSMVTGREIYGWPKVLSKLEHCDANGRCQRLRHVRHLPMPIPTQLTVEAFSNRADEPLDVPYDEHVIMTIDGRVGGGPATGLFRGVRELGNALNVLDDMFLGRFALALEEEDAYGGDDGTFVALRELLTQLRTDGGSHETGISHVHLKQFRDIRWPDRACYQAIIQSPLHLERFHDGGFLLGDYSVKLHHCDSAPIIRHLGLNVKDASGKDVAWEPLENTDPSFQRDPARSDDVMVPQVIPKEDYYAIPKAPFWAHTDVTYGLGERVYFVDTGGQRQSGVSERNAYSGLREVVYKRISRPVEDPIGGPVDGPADKRNEEPQLPLYVRRGSARVSPGPFAFKSANLRAFMVKASYETLKCLTDRYLSICPTGDLPRYRPMGDVVILLTIDYGKPVPSIKNGTIFPVEEPGSWGQQELMVTVPLVEYSGELEEDRRNETDPLNGEVFKGIALFTPYVYTDSEWAMLTGRERFGWPKVFTDDSFRDRDARPAHLRTSPVIMPTPTTLSTSVFTEEGDDRDAPWQEKPVFEFVMGEATRETDVHVGFEDIVDAILPKLRMPLRESDHDRLKKYLMGWGPRSNGKTSEVRKVALKQFRDAVDPRLACYQAIVETPISVDYSQSKGSLRGDYQILLQHHESEPILSRLGLDVVRVKDADGTPVPKEKQEVTRSRDKIGCPCTKLGVQPRHDDVKWLDLDRGATYAIKGGPLAQWYARVDLDYGLGTAVHSLDFSSALA